MSKEISEQAPTFRKKFDANIAIEQSIQQKYSEDNKIRSTRKNGQDKFFATFPYPYMNGRMHLGHALTLCTAEFTARYHGLSGKNVLFPFAFHGSGMPIAASANRVRDEIGEMPITEETYQEIESKNDRAQVVILRKMGISIEEMHMFSDPYYWIKYFPEKAKEDLTKFGLSADFKKSFMTTDINPYYDSFVKWQFEILHRGGKLVFGKKPIIFSPKDGQSCADHDRSVGEGIGIDNYYLVYFSILSKENTFIVVPIKTESICSLIDATSMCINPDTEIVEFTFENRTLISTIDVYRNMLYQSIASNEFTTIDPRTILGESVINPETSSTIIVEEFWVYDSSKDTGIKLSTPLFDVEDFIVFTKRFRDVIPISNLKVNPYSWIKAEFAKSKVDLQTKLIKQFYSEKYVNQSFQKFYMPAGRIISRSGDKCVVSICDQWFINYGDPEWTEKVFNYVKDSNCFETYDITVKAAFTEAVNWLSEWPCSRSFGLGTKLLDTQYIIDSLSDSTVYMAYYTVCDIVCDIPPEKLSFEFWEYIFRDGSFPEEFSEYQSTMDLAKSEFNYWYPLDLRVSGKDLIFNHLTMALYNHCEIWGESKMPKSYHVNGYMMLNGEKMSKQTGNFMTIDEAISKYGADATRMTIARAGCTQDDSNFNEQAADTAILQITTEREVLINMIDYIKQGSPNNDLDFWGQVFKAEIRSAVLTAKQEYENINFTAVMAGGHDALVNARKHYYEKCEKQLCTLNHTLVKEYIQLYLAVIYPICPHMADYVWDCAQGLDIVKGWPEFDGLDHQYLWYSNKINHTIQNIKSAKQSWLKKTKYAKSVNPDFVCGNPTITLETIVYTEDELSIIDDLINSNPITDSKKKKFANYASGCARVYSNDWFSFSKDDYEIFSKVLPPIIEGINCDDGSKFVIKKATESTKLPKKGVFMPFNPFISM